jgi:hypothetical protein
MVIEIADAAARLHGSLCGIMGVGAQIIDKAFFQQGLEALLYPSSLPSYDGIIVSLKLGTHIYHLSGIVRIFYDAQIAFHMGQDRLITDLPNLLKALAHIYRTDSRHKLYQDMVCACQGQYLACQEVCCHAAVIHDLISRVKSNGNLPVVNAFLEGSDLTVDGLRGGTTMIGLIVRRYNDIGNAIVRSRPEHLDALQNALCPIIHPREYMAVDIYHGTCIHIPICLFAK